MRRDARPLDGAGRPRGMSSRLCTRRWAARVRLRQTVLPELGDQTQQRQVELDLEHLATRESRIATELLEEPKAIEALYAVQMTRLTPVGLVIAWPEAMT